MATNNQQETITGMELLKAEARCLMGKLIDLLKEILAPGSLWMLNRIRNRSKEYVRKDKTRWIDS